MMEKLKRESLNFRFKVNVEKTKSMSPENITVVSKQNPRILILLRIPKNAIQLGEGFRNHTTWSVITSFIVIVV